MSNPSSGVVVDFNGPSHVTMLDEHGEFNSFLIFFFLSGCRRRRCRPV